MRLIMVSIRRNITPLYKRKLTITQPDSDSPCSIELGSRERVAIDAAVAQIKARPAISSPPQPALVQSNKATVAEFRPSSLLEVLQHERDGAANREAVANQKARMSCGNSHLIAAWRKSKRELEVAETALRAEVD
jgi:hypothetical protein